jgi:predicted nucleotidyltransferase
MKEVTREDILDYLKENKRYLFSEYHLTKIGIFGSFAKGEATDSSDIDLLVEFEPDTEELLEKKIRIKNMIKRQFNVEVDICREKYIKPYFKSQILNSVIYV